MENNLFALEVLFFLGSKRLFRLFYQVGMEGTAKRELSDQKTVREIVVAIRQNGRQATVNAVSDLPKSTSWPSHALSWVTVLAASRCIAISVER